MRERVEGRLSKDQARQGVLRPREGKGAEKKRSRGHPRQREVSMQAPLMETSLREAWGQVMARHLCYIAHTGT